MKNKIDCTTEITLDEIRYQLIENLSVNELVNFVLDIGDNMSESESYYLSLKKKLNKMEFE